MASLSLINKVKYSKNLYTVYFYLGSFAIRLLNKIIRKDPRLIVFSSYGGRKFDDSPKCIYEKMIMDPRFREFKIVWAFMQPANYEIPRGDKIKTDTYLYFKTLLKASCWVTNSTMERGLSFKDKSVFYYNSWHGTPIKLMGCDIDKSNQSFAGKGHGCPYDVFCAQSKYDADIFIRTFGVSEKAMKIIGLPRNDELLNDAGIERIKEIKGKLGIPQSKKVILYAPTFREYTKDDDHNCVLVPPIDLEKWEKTLGKNWVLLFRAHYEVVKVLNISSNDFVIDVSSYPLLNELMIVSDILISDYSSIFFDYSILGKPMLCFAFDYEEYQRKRGLYFDIRKELDCMEMDNEDRVLDEIMNMDVKKREEVVKRFRGKYVERYGAATEDSLELIYERLKDND